MTPLDQTLDQTLDDDDDYRSFRETPRSHRRITPITPTIVHIGNSTILIHGDDASEVAMLVHAAIMQYQGVEYDQ